MAITPWINPWTVRRPKSRLDPASLRVVLIAQWWSLAIGIWDGNRALLIRWNGDPSHKLGNPQSHAQPTWFVLPDDLHSRVLAIAGASGKLAIDWLNGTGPDYCATIPDQTG